MYSRFSRTGEAIEKYIDFFSLELQVVHFLILKSIHIKWQFLLFELCNSASRAAYNKVRDTWFTLFVLLWSIARTWTERKKNLRISWTSNLSLQECLLKYKWLSVVTFYDMFEYTIKISRQWKCKWLCCLLWYSETISNIVCIYFMSCFFFCGVTRFWSLWCCWL